MLQVVDPDHLEITLLPSIDSEDTSKGTKYYLILLS